MIGKKVAYLRINDWRVAIVTLLAALSLVLLGTSAHAQTVAQTHSQANVQVAAHAAPAVSGFYIVNQAGYGELWDDVTNSIYKTSHSNHTPLTQKNCVNNSWCQEVAPNGSCMEWDLNGGNIVIPDTCNTSRKSQFWGAQSWGSSYTILNEYAQGLTSCSGAFELVLTGISSGAQVTLACPGLSGGTPDSSQLWQSSST